MTNGLRLAIPQQALADFCRRWMISELAVFGSALRESFRADSDVDLLVTFAPEARWRLADYARMQEELEGIVGRKVDLVEKSSVERSENYIRRKRILASAEPLYVAG